MSILFSKVWPDALDWGAMLFFFALALGVPVLGYLIMVVDVRAYLRALRGVLVRAVFHFPEIPGWARYETPGCLKALGLTLPCTEDDVKQAYRKRAESLHPDRGGDRQMFLKLQRQFEESMRFLDAHELASPRDASQDVENQSEAS